MFYSGLKKYIYFFIFFVRNLEKYAKKIELNVVIAYSKH